MIKPKIVADLAKLFSHCNELGLCWVSWSWTLNQSPKSGIKLSSHHRGKKWGETPHHTKQHSCIQKTYRSAARTKIPQNTEPHQRKDIHPSISFNKPEQKTQQPIIARLGKSQPEAPKDQHQESRRRLCKQKSKSSFTPSNREREKSPLRLAEKEDTWGPLQGEGAGSSQREMRLLGQMFHFTWETWESTFEVFKKWRGKCSYDRSYSTLIFRLQLPFILWCIKSCGQLYFSQDDTDGRNERTIIQCL